MNTSGVEIGEVVCRALQSLEKRRKEEGDGKGGGQSVKWGLIMKETELGGKSRQRMTKIGSEARRDRDKVKEKKKKWEAKKREQSV